MGSVYLARHEDLNRTAAVKVMLALGDDPVAAGRFRREGRAIALLRHPSIVTVYDYGTYEGTPRMVKQYVQGGSLANRLKQARPTREAAIKWLRGIAAGLDYAHQSSSTSSPDCVAQSRPPIRLQVSWPARLFRRARLSSARVQTPLQPASQSSSPAQVSRPEIHCLSLLTAQVIAPIPLPA